MGKHTLYTRGLVFEWDDAVKDYSRERSLLDLYSHIGNMHDLTTYIGEDPEKEWNGHVAKLQDEVIDWIIELRDKSKENI